MKHVMLDIETLGTTPGSVVLSIGACRFDASGVDEDAVFYHHVSITDQVNCGLTIDPNTVMWWLQQGDAARRAITIGQRTATPLVSALRSFSGWFESLPDSTVWANGATFDCVLLEAVYRATAKAGLYIWDANTPWSYRAPRDVRTVFDLAGKRVGAFGTENPVAHDALQDAIYQAKETRLALLSMGVWK